MHKTEALRGEKMHRTELEELENDKNKKNYQTNEMQTEQHAAVAGVFLWASATQTWYSSYSSLYTAVKSAV